MSSISFNAAFSLSSTSSFMWAAGMLSGAARQCQVLPGNVRCPVTAGGLESSSKKCHGQTCLFLCHRNLPSVLIPIILDKQPTQLWLQSIKVNITPACHTNNRRAPTIALAIFHQSVKPECLCLVIFYCFIGQWSRAKEIFTQFRFHWVFRLTSYNGLHRNKTGAMGYIGGRLKTTGFTSLLWFVSSRV